MKIIQTIIMSILMLGVNSPAWAQIGPIIRDTEIESVMQEWFAPIYAAADISPNSVDIIIVQSDQLNAFVAGGANMFFYTGLIKRTERPEELMGVFAHELGHIQGGHLIGLRGAQQRASYESILGTVLGLGAALLTGDGRAAAAVGQAATGLAANRFLAHSRVNESAADQAALTYFEDAGYDPDGLLTFFEKLQSEEFRPASQQSEYFRTHPLTQNRIEAIRAGQERSAHVGKMAPPEWSEQHARIKAKLIAFTDPGRVAWTYDDRDTTIPARYARAVAAYRQTQIETALSEINALIAIEPDNPYFHELKGQMLRDFSRLDEAIESYETALEIKPEAALIRIALGHTILSNAKSEGEIETAINHFLQARDKEARNAQLRRWLGIAYGRIGQEDIANTYLAEEALLRRNYALAIRYAKSALETLPEASREALRAKDIVQFAENAQERAK